MKLLAFAASTSSSSINKRLVTHAAEVFQKEVAPEATVQVIDLNDYEMPIYSSDREAASGIPELAQHLFDKIGEADALLISFAEHNGHYTAAWKNTFDWMSRLGMKVFQDTPMIAMAASPGGRGGATVLEAAVSSAGYFGANIKGSLSVGPFGEKFDTVSGVLSDAELSADLKQMLMGLKDA
ncbi:MAG: NAD(P)H-dependent oxidoreductase [Litoreibacter sp.]|uniref:NADPH-dependent FMN reductase n=1 Tax=Litoreibacter sp. TaxID=1969459 RepID=UPI003297AD79